MGAPVIKWRPMIELAIAQSFIVRIYRLDPDNPKLLTGQVEAMDGSGVRIPFADSDGLVEILGRGSVKRKARKGRAALPTKG